MTKEDQGPGEDPLQRALSSFDRRDVPGLEVLLIDRLASWFFSPSNPGEDYGENEAGELTQILFECMADAGHAPVDRVPGDGGKVGCARDRVAAGAGELAHAERGKYLVITRAMPAMVGQLNEHAGEVGAQLQGTYLFLLLAVATGTGERAEPDVVEGLLMSFAAWDELFAEGAAPAWTQAGATREQ